MREIKYQEQDVEFIDKPSYLVVGAAHLHKVPESRIPTFVEKISKLSGMKLEATPIPANVPFNLVEVLAKVCMQGKPLEYIASTRPNGDDLAKIYQEYGIPVEITELRYALRPLFVGDMIPIHSAEDMMDEVILSLNAGKERVPNIDVQRGLDYCEKVMKALLNSSVTMDEVQWFFNSIYIYHGHVVEYEFMQPDVLDFRRRIDGKIGVVIGRLHHLNIAKLLDGEKIRQPPVWDRYQEIIGLPCYDSIEKILQGD